MNILRLEISSRGGGVEISLPNGQKMSAFQNYLGGGMLGKINVACTISNWINDAKLVDIADKLCRYYHEQTGAGNDFNEQQKLPSRGY